MAGDDEKVAVADRPLAQQVRSEPDPYRAVELLAGLFTGIGGRYAEIDAVLWGAAHSGDPDLRTMWQTSEERRLFGARMWVTTLAEKGPLRDGVDVETAIDVLWLYMAPDQYHRLVHAPGVVTGALSRSGCPTPSAGSSFPVADRPVGGERRGGRSVVTAAAE